MNTQSLSNLPLDLTPGALAVLGFVRPRASHGYDIYRQLTGSAELRRVWQMKQSRLYALLARLEELGLLLATVEPSDGHPPRKVFHLTAAGAAAFERWLAEPVAQPREMRLEFMLKFYFALRDGPETARRLVSAQQATCAAWPDMRPDPADGPFLSAVVAYRRAHIAAIHDWLAALAAELATTATTH